MSKSGVDLQRFTATGRPMPDEKQLRKGRAMNSLAGFESLGAGPANFAPVRFTDDSIISIPVQPSPPYPESVNEPEVKEEKRKFSLSGLRRKSKAERQPAFIMKQVTRGEYLMYYAKDDDGKYCGTEDPAADCILSNTDDILKYRKPRDFSKLQTRSADSGNIAFCGAPVTIGGF